MARRSRSKESETEKKSVVVDEGMDWEFVEELLKLDNLRTMLLYGKPGTGKTYCAIYKGQRAEYIVTLTPDTPAAELRGTWIPAGDRFEWHDGPLTAAMREGARVVINEITHASDDVMALLYPLLESAATAQLTLPTRETVRPAPGFQVICTDNQPPTQLPPALQDRFEVICEITEPHPEALALLPEKLRRAAVRSCSLEDDRAVGMRSWLMLDRLSSKLGMDKAARAVFGRERGVQILDALAMAQEELAF